MQNTIAKDSLSKNVKENEMALAKGNNGIIKKGDTFVQYKPRHSMIFMKVNDVRAYRNDGFLHCHMAHAGCQRTQCSKSLPYGSTQWRVLRICCD